MATGASGGSAPQPAVPRASADGPARAGVAPPSSRASPPPPPAPPAVAAQIRLTLATEYDETTRSALDTLHDMLARHPNPRIPITERARQHLEMGVDADANAATAEFCDALASVDQALSTVHTDLVAMREECAATRDALTHAHRAAASLLDHAHGLETQRGTALGHQALAERLLARLRLTKEEEAALQLTEVPVSDALFAAMDRLHVIRDESLVLLGAAETPGPAASELRAEAAAQLDTAFRKVFRWCSLELRQQPKEGTDAGVLLQEALRRLAEHPELLRSVLRIFTDTRASYLPELFLRALRVGGGPPHYLPRPIEVHAHDATRYVADMLAWVHQALAGERELVAAMLARLVPRADDAAPRRIGERHVRDEDEGAGGASDDELALLAQRDAPPQAARRVYERLLRQVLDQNLAGCCRPLHTRVVQTLELQRDGVTSVRLYYLLRFYYDTMRYTLGDGAALSGALRDLVSRSEQAFRGSLRGVQDALLHTAEQAPVPSELGAPPALRDAAITLRGLAAEIQSAAEGQRGRPSDEKNAVQDPVPQLVADTLIAPLHRAARRLAERVAAAPEAPAPSWSARLWGWGRGAPDEEEQRRARAAAQARWRGDVLLMNALELPYAVLRQYPHLAAAHTAQLRSELIEAARRLCRMHCTTLLEESGLGKVLPVASAAEADAAQPEKAGAGRPTESKTDIAALRAFLASPNLLIPPPELEALSVPAVRNTIHHAALREFAHRYEGIYGQLVAERGPAGGQGEAPAATPSGEAPAAAPAGKAPAAAPAGDAPVATPAGDAPGAPPPTPHEITLLLDLDGARDKSVDDVLAALWDTQAPAPRSRRG